MQHPGPLPNAAFTVSTAGPEPRVPRERASPSPAESRRVSAGPGLRAVSCHDMWRKPVQEPTQLPAG